MRRNAALWYSRWYPHLQACKLLIINSCTNIRPAILANRLVATAYSIFTARAHQSQFFSRRVSQQLVRVFAGPGFSNVANHRPRRLHSLRSWSGSLLLSSITKSRKREQQAGKPGRCSEANMGARGHRPRRQRRCAVQRWATLWTQPPTAPHRDSGMHAVLLVPVCAVDNTSLERCYSTE